MIIDLGSRANLSIKEKHELTTVMHYSLLDSLFREAQWNPGEAVFHGGTAIKVLWNSPRFSSDLDFMLSEHKVSELDGVIKKSVSTMARRLMVDLPGSKFSVKPPKDAANNVQKYEIRWEHPNRVGNVMVKLEFYKVPSDKLDRYKTLVTKPDPDPTTKMVITTPLIGPELISVLADKYVALGLREYFKHRDVFDIWNTTQMSIRSANPDSADFNLIAEEVEHVADIYSKTIIDVKDGLFQRLEEEEFRDPKLLEQSLSTFLPEVVHEGFLRGDTYTKMLSSVRNQVDELIVILQKKIEENHGWKR